MYVVQNTIFAKSPHSRVVRLVSGKGKSVMEIALNCCIQAGYVHSAAGSSSTSAVCG